MRTFPLVLATFVACGPPSPEPPTHRPAVHLASGRHTTCSVLDTGTIRCWGSDLRDPGTNPRDLSWDRCIFQGDNPRIDVMPRDVPGITDAIEVAVGDRHACARTATGGVWCWGRDLSGETGAGLSKLTNVVQVGAGLQHSCASLANGTVHCWGENQFGQLGDGTGTDRSAPVAVVGIDDAEQLAVGGSHSCVLRATGEVWCWGSNVAGALGDGTDMERHTPVAVTGLSDVVEVAAGWFLTCARTRAGAVWCWGDFKVENGSFTLFPPTGIARGTDLVGIRMGWSNLCVLHGSDSTAECFGGTALFVPDGGMSAPSVLQRPSRVMPFTDVADVSIGHESFCARRSSGEVECLGQNICGNLGDGTVTNHWDASSVVPL